MGNPRWSLALSLMSFPRSHNFYSHFPFPSLFFVSHFDYFSSLAIPPLIPNPPLEIFSLGPILSSTLYPNSSHSTFFHFPLSNFFFFYFFTSFFALPIIHITIMSIYIFARSFSGHLGNLPFPLPYPPTYGILFCDGFNLISYVLNAL